MFPPTVAGPGEHRRQSRASPLARRSSHTTINFGPWPCHVWPLQRSRPTAVYQYNDRWVWAPPRHLRLIKHRNTSRTARPSLERRPEGCLRCTGARCWGRQRQSTRRELSSPPTKCNTSTDRSISLRGTWLSSFSICTCHVLLERSCLSVDRLRRQGTQGQQSGDGGAEASCAHSRSLHIDPDRPEAVTGVSEML